MDAPATNTILKFVIVGLIAAVGGVVLPGMLAKAGFPLSGEMLAIVLIIIGVVLIMFLKGMSVVGGGVIAAGAIVLGTKYLNPIFAPVVA